MIDQFIKKIVRIKRVFFLIAGFLIVSLYTYSQNLHSTDSAQYLTLDQCIAYALQHQPGVKQSDIGISIAKTTNDINLSGQLPQVGLSGNLIHYNELPTSFIKNSNGVLSNEQNGVINTFVPALSVSQTIYNPALSYAAKSASLYVKQAEQDADSTRIDLIASVSQSFYSLLLTLQQIDILKEDTVNLAQNFKDSYHQYIGGIVDQTDYKEAAITLNNTKGQLIQAVENVFPEYAALKQQMGYPQNQQFNVSFDTTKMMNEIAFDTTQQLNYEQRIEYQQLQTSGALQKQITEYYRHAYLPTVGAFFNYYPEFENNNFSQLFSSLYPYSTIGLSISMPIFTGLARVKNLQRSQMQQQLIDLDKENLKAEIFTEFATAKANYKSNLANFYFLKDNIGMAQDVYRIVSLQYKQGTVAYLNVITAESNLITSQIGYLNSLLQVLSSKIALKKAMGLISVNR